MSEPKRRRPGGEAGRRLSAPLAAVTPVRFDPTCTRCPRLAAHLRAVRRTHPLYHAHPVAAFGAKAPKLLIVGLAPGMHGANRTGRPFTGDHAGILLYATLHRYGFANQPIARAANDGLRLLNCQITNAVRCLPPGNRPTPEEVRTCAGHLAHDLARVKPRAVILALGQVAHGAVLRALGLRQSAARFAHGARHVLPGGRVLLDSYHCSRYNTQTGRLTEAMFASVVATARALIDARWD